MKLKRLSELLERVQPTRRAAYYRAFRVAIISGEVRAVELVDTLRMPKTKTKGNRELQDYAIEETESFTKWHAQMTARVSSRNSRAPTWAELTSDEGSARFETAAEETKKRLERQKARAVKVAEKKSKAVAPKK